MGVQDILFTALPPFPQVLLRFGSPEQKSTVCASYFFLSRLSFPVLSTTVVLCCFYFLVVFVVLRNCKVVRQEQLLM